MCRCKDSDEIETIEPIRVLLNSTLNVEFVYVLLDGIVQFSKLNFAHGSSGSEDIHVVNEQNGDVTLKISQIKVQDIDDWEPNQDQMHIKQ